MAGQPRMMGKHPPTRGTHRLGSAARPARRNLWCCWPACFRPAATFPGTAGGQWPSKITVSSATRPEAHGIRKALPPHLQQERLATLSSKQFPTPEVVPRISWRLRNAQAVHWLWLHGTVLAGGNRPWRLAYVILLQLPDNSHRSAPSHNTPWHVMPVFAQSTVGCRLLLLISQLLETLDMHPSFGGCLVHLSLGMPPLLRVSS
mmetsp:Transcript_35234/g.81216  ORF Transcript_35234/g.81216 Transcript_35234/m.81216 type:complete len:204 (-) Transcript_35234:737-1348(-)